MKITKIWLWSLLLVGSALMSGCSSIPPEAYAQANENAIISDTFVLLMEQGQTTRAEEQAFIKANRRSWHAQNFALNEAPLPPDMENPSDANLRAILEADVAIRQRAKELRELMGTLEEETPATNSTGE